MICQRCGTEFHNDENICPRCGYGRPKPKMHLPRWLWWTVGIATPVLVVAISLALYMQFYLSSGWVHGAWEGQEMSLILNLDRELFMLENHGVKMTGSFTLGEDTLGLTTEEGEMYVYRYERLSANRMRLQYNTQDDGTRQITVSRTGKDAGSLIFSEDQLELPRLYLDTGRVEIESIEEYINASITVKNAAKRKYNLNEHIVTVRGRGNSTWRYFDKKPYKLKFTKPVDLLGMGAAKEWVLLANAFDETMLRNYLAFTIAKELEMEFATEYQYVNLFLNGEYVGVYLLCEQMEEGPTRVDVAETVPAQVDTGYFLKTIDTKSSNESALYFKLPEVNGQSLGDRGMFRFYINSPDETECTDAQYDFISDYVEQANEAIFNQDWEQICQLVDIDSMVKMFLLDEVLLNNDMGYSFYLYKKPGGKLYMGPGWDYDQSCGGSAWGGPTYVGYETGSTHYWYNTLIDMPQFRELLVKEYLDHAAFFRGLPELTQEIYEENQYDFDMNNDRWEELFGDRHKYRRIEELMVLETYDEHLQYMQTWLTNRLEWLETDLGIE